MILIKNFSIFKLKEQKSEKSPTHRFSAKVGEEYITFASAWTKETKGGDKFLSCKMQDAYLDHTDNSKSRQSFVVIAENDLKELAKLAGIELPTEDTTVKSSREAI